MTAPSIVFLLGLVLVQTSAEPQIERILETAVTWERFLDGVKAQRELWVRTTEGADVDPDLVERISRTAKGLQLLVVAEDWCPDSAYAVPYVAQLAGLAGVPLRVIDRARGEALMRAHRTGDGRMATPTVVVLRDGVDVGAWVERPEALQSLFRSMSGNPENARRFADRAGWYEADRGRSVLKEIVALVEQSSAK
jgi:hypothetical protein